MKRRYETSVRLSSLTSGDRVRLESPTYWETSIMAFVFARTGLGLSLAAVLTLALSLPAAEDKPDAGWPVFRGNALQTGVAASSLPAQLEVLWRFKAKDGFEGTAAIANGTVYVGSYDEYLYAIDLKTGQEKWKYKANSFRVAAAVRGGAVYLGDIEGIFHCVDAATGKPRWKFETGAEITSGANFAGDNVLFGCGDETLYCLSKEGQKLWQFKVAGGPVMGTPAVVGDRTFVSGCDSTLHILDIANGKELGAVELGGQTGATVAVQGEQLYVGTMTKQVLGIDWKKAEVVWKFEAARRANDFYSSAAVTPDMVIVGSRDKRVHALDRATGKEKWSVPTRGHVDSSPVVVGDRVFVGSLDGTLYVIDLVQGAVRKKFELGKKGITASPAVAENCLVIGTLDDEVVCLGAK
jgi:outer membrane protein assembly factor BamB